MAECIRQYYIHPTYHQQSMHMSSQLIFTQDILPLIKNDPTPTLSNKHQHGSFHSPSLFLFPPFFMQVCLFHQQLNCTSLKCEFNENTSEYKVLVEEPWKFIVPWWLLAWLFGEQSRQNIKYVGNIFYGGRGVVVKKSVGGNMFDDLCSLISLKMGDEDEERRWISETEKTTHQIFICLLFTTNDELWIRDGMAFFSSLDHPRSLVSFYGIITL